jgi:RsiW-degrading membrane proteinase PrsW (M82 family)
MLESSSEPEPQAQAGVAAPARSIRLDVLAVSLAVAGGAFGIIGAAFQEVVNGGLLVIFIGAPLIEEALKPIGVYWLLIRWPQALKGQLHTAALCGLSGLTFGAIESLVYVSLYYPEGGDEFVLFRFTVPLAMHAIASFIVGLGLSRAVIDWAAGRGAFPKRFRNAYIAGAGLHALYNTTVVILALSGFDPLDFES